MKTKRKNEWYRRPKEEIVTEHLFLDGDKTISIIESVVEEALDIKTNKIVNDVKEIMNNGKVD